MKSRARSEESKLISILLQLVFLAFQYPRRKKGEYMSWGTKNLVQLFKHQKKFRNFDSLNIPRVMCVTSCVTRLQSRLERVPFLRATLKISRSARANNTWGNFNASFHCYSPFALTKTSACCYRCWNSISFSSIYCRFAFKAIIELQPNKPFSMKWPFISVKSPLPPNQIILWNFVAA